jgi:hypothetical protein
MPLPVRLETQTAVATYTFAEDGRRRELETDETLWPRWRPAGE